MWDKIDQKWKTIYFDIGWQWCDGWIPNSLNLSILLSTGAAPPGGGEEQGGEGGAEEAAGEHDAADDRHGAEAEHHLSQLLQGPARESFQQQQVHVNLW